MTSANRPRRAAGWAPDLSTFGARLALLRQAMGWGNVAEAATACGLPVGSWRNWERDGREPRSLVSTCMKIAGVTGVDLDWLIRGPQGYAPQVGAARRVTGAYRPGQRLVATIAIPAAKPAGRIIRARPIEDRYLSLGHGSPLAVVGYMTGMTTCLR